MIKIFTLLNLAGLLLFNALMGSDVGISQDLPSSIQPGTEVRVTVTVDKAQITGFAKLQIDLPPGLTATAIETKGASFTFADGKAKFIWMAMPAQPSFKVSYTLAAAADAKGTMPVTGRFSYIQDNERKTVDLPPGTITIGNADASMMANTGDTTPSSSDTGTVTSASTGTGNADNDLASAGNDDPVSAPDGQAASDMPPPQGPGNISAKRIISRVSSSEVLVTVTIDKGDLRGFGKLQENLPIGFSAVSKENDEAIFSTKDQVAKFIWLNLPSKNELTVSYQLVANDQPEGEYTISGDFGYLMNDLTQRYEVGQTKFFTGVRAMQGEVAIAEQPAPKPAPPATATQTAHPPANAPKTAAETVTAQAAKVTSVPSPETGITYKVQITAAHREVGHPYFIQRHHYSGDFSIEHHEGWIKYVTGNFDAYAAARDRRQSYIAANYNFPGPFVTAYNNGERITVQEALMIARQHSAQ